MDIQLDSVQTVLVDFQLTEHEAEFRNVLATLGSGQPTVRQLSLALTAQMMSLSGVPWPVIMRAINCLSSVSDAELEADAAVGLVNGQYLVVSDKDGGALKVNIRTSEAVEELPPAITTTVYSVAATWEKVKNALDT